MINQQVIVDRAYLEELEKFREGYHPDPMKSTLTEEDIIKLQVASKHIKKFIENTWSSLYHAKALDKDDRGKEIGYTMDVLAKMIENIENLGKVRDKFDASKKEEETL